MIIIAVKRPLRDIRNEITILKGQLLPDSKNYEAQCRKAGDKSGAYYWLQENVKGKERLKTLEEEVKSRTKK